MGNARRVEAVSEVVSDVEALRLEVEALEKAEDEAKAASAAASVALAKARLRLFDLEGKGSSIEARWNRAWLAGDSAECQRMLALRYPQFAEVKRPVTDEERERLLAEAKRLEAEERSIAG